MALGLMGCEWEELPVEPYVPGAAQSVSVEMGDDYRNQIFFDLHQQLVVSQNLKTDWDLAFEAGTLGWRVRLNGARGGALAHTGRSDWSAAVGLPGLVWGYDASSGHPDSTAMGDYRADGEVVVIDRGYDAAGNHTGYFKMQVLGVDSLRYRVRFGQLNGSGEHSLDIPKRADLNWVSYSFSQASVVQIEPPSADWDVVFTQYTHVFRDPLQPYLVAGVLLNPTQVSVAEVLHIPFDSLSRQDALALPFQSQEDVIGYDWKVYDFDAGQYEVVPGITYVVRDSLGRIFKLKFVDFYSDLGEKGTPRFVWQEL